MTRRLGPFVLLFACVSLGAARMADAACPTTVSVNVAPPTLAPGTDRAVVSVTYDFTGAGSGQLTLEGVSTQPVNGASGTHDFYVQMGCASSGPRTFRATATPHGSGCSDADSATAEETINVEATPEISASPIGMIGDTTLSVLADWSFPLTGTSQFNREIRFFIDGAAGSPIYATDKEGSGTLTVNGVSCLKRGTHTLTARARSCGLADADHNTFSTATTFDIEPAKVTGVSFRPTQNGFIANVGYAFQTTSPNSDQRLISSRFNGFPGTGTTQLASSGNVDLNLNFGCMAPGTYPVTIYAVACGYFGWDPDKTHEVSTSVRLPIEMPRGAVDLEARYDPATRQVYLKGTQTLPSGISSAQRVIRRLAATGEDGQRIAEAVIDTSTVTTGAFAFGPIGLPTGARQFQFEATLEFCNGQAKDVAAVDCACDEATQAPVYLSDGNMRYSDAEPLPAQLGRLAFTRTYDSHHRFRGSLGRGWWSMFDRRLTVTPSSFGETIVMTTDTNESVVFARNSAGGYTQYWPQNARAVGSLVKDSGALVFRYRPPHTTSEHLYRISDGRYVGQRELGTGRHMTIAYDSNGLPVSVADSFSDLMWTIATDATERRITSITSGNVTWTYQYDANDNLTTVLAPGNTAWRTYEHLNDLMTAARDALGNLIESHDYDANGVAINSTGQGDEIESIEYGLPGSTPDERITRLTLKTGAVTDHVLRLAGGGYRTVQVIGDCVTCGGHGDRTYVRDHQGRIVRDQRADGFIDVTVYTNDRVESEERNLKPVGCDPLTAIDQCRMTTDELVVAQLEPTGATVKTEYTYSDSNWPERPTRIRTPSVAVSGAFRDETYVYHPLTGEVVTRTVAGQAGNVSAPASRGMATLLYENAPGQTDGLQPAFDPGGTFLPAWMSLPQPLLLSRSTDGPRTDVQDVTSYVYYPVDPSVPALLRSRLAAVKNAAGHITRFDSYDAFGNITRVVDANGVATEMTYDALGRLATSTLKGIPGCDTAADALCATDLVTSRGYSPVAGPLSEEVRAGGGTTTYTYDSRGRVRTMSRGPSASDQRERIETSYDPLTGMKSLERILGFENGNWVEKKRESYGYTADRLLETLTHADGASVGYVYDAAGRLSGTRDEKHAQPNTTYTYDPAGRLQTVEQTLSDHPQGFITTSYGYDVHGNLTSVTDPNGNVTTYRYDDFGLLVNQASPVTGTTVYGYDTAGNATLTQMANATSTTRTFDALNRLTVAVSSRNGAGAESVTWTYDDATPGRFGIGRVAADVTSNTVYRYERRGMPAQETRTTIVGPGGTSVIFTTKYTYDQDGNRSSITYPSNQLIVTYTFDYAGRPLTASGAVASAEYLPFGPLKRLEFTNGTRQVLAYDSRYRVEANQLVDTTTSVELADYDYQSDPAGNIERIDDLLDSGYDRMFGYDDLHRLTSANTGPALWITGEYEWDAMGNILSMKLGEIPPGGDDGLLRRRGIGTDENRPLGRSSSFAYAGTTSLLAEVTTNHLARPVTHDAAGNETGYIVTREYSSRNLLWTVRDNVEPGAEDHRVSYRYDGRGVRISRLELPVSSEFGAQRHYVYTPELSLLAATRDSHANWWDGSANPVSGQVFHYEIIWFGSRPVAQVTPGGAIRFTFTDHLATPQLQTDSARNVIWRAEYEPFGNIYEMRVGNRNDQPLRFPGQEAAMTWEGLDENYNIFRWYRAGWGRYTQADPIGLDGGKNLYGYARSNPLTYIDPLGLATNPRDLDCCQLGSEINRLKDELRRRMAEEEAIQRQLVQGVLGRTYAQAIYRYWQHYGQYVGKQKRLNRLVREYDGRPCDPPLPQEVRQWAGREFPDDDYIWESYRDFLEDVLVNGPPRPRGPVVVGVPPVVPMPIPVFP